MQADSTGVRVTELETGGAAEEAGVQPGDILVQVGEFVVNDAAFGVRFRQRYSRAEGQTIPLTVRRGDQTLNLSMRVRISVRVQESVVFDQNASPRALRIRKGILTGS